MKNSKIYWPSNKGFQYAIHPSWKECLDPYLASNHFAKIHKFIAREIALGKGIYPNNDQYFKAFELTPLCETKCVIIGQDPYHKNGQAMGLAFSVSEGMGIPPSLRNVFKELHTDIGIEMPQSGDLSPWAMKGVLLLNETLTVEDNKPLSHANIGWSILFQSVMEHISSRLEAVVFVLLGKSAAEAMRYIDQSKHLVVVLPHPSPLSAYRGFFGSRPFSKANTWLISKGKEPIDWKL